MRTSSKWVVVLLTGLVGGTVAGAQCFSPAAAPPGSVRISSRALSASYGLEDPKSIEITLTNVSDKPVSFFSYNDFDQGGRLYHIELRNEDGTAVEETRRGKVLNRHLRTEEMTTKEELSIDTASGACVVIKPRQSYTGHIDLGLLYRITSVGRYQVTISVPQLGNIVQANSSKSDSSSTSNNKKPPASISPPAADLRSVTVSMQVSQ